MTGSVSSAPKTNTSLRLLSAESAKNLMSELDALAENASPVDALITDLVTLLEYKGEAWFCIDSFYAQRAVSEALKERGFPASSTSNCLISEKYPKYIRADLFNDSIQSLIMAAGKFGEPDSDDLVRVVMNFNRIELSWPQDDDQALDFATYFVLMTGAKGQLIYDKRLGCAVRLNSMTIRQSQNGPVVIFATQVKMAFGVEVTLLDAHVTESVFEYSSLARLRFVPMTDAMLATLIESGKDIAQRLLQAEATHGQIKGVGFISGMMGKKVSINVSGRVIHDPCGCHELMPDDFNSLLRLYDLYVDDEGDIVTAPIHDDKSYAQLMPYGILYDLGMSRWLIANVADLKPVEFRPNAFDQLVLDPNKKSMIRAIVKNREVVENAGAIHGKGAGAIFLLAGEPGCGKTMTAEAVAESIRKPLFKVNLGTLSSDIQKLEARLSEVLQLAARWDAVLLIDEADAYMESRDSSDLHRNALVAVFLRLLEYYTGVLFTTTNRGSNIDSAFWSRITLAFHYPKLDNAALRTIWKNMLGNVGIEVSDEEIEGLLTFGANGREIGNAINAAQSLAFEDNQAVSAKHIRAILGVKKQFMDSLQDPLTRA